MLRLATKFAPRSADEFRLAYEAGYRAAEFWLNDELIDDWKSIVALASDFPMTYALHFPNRGNLASNHLRNVVHLYNALDAPVLVIHQPMYEQYGKHLLALDSELKLGLENHVLSDPSQLSEWATRSKWLTLDVEHLWMYTIENGSLKRLLKTLHGFLRTFGHKIAHVHLPGYLPGFPLHRPQYCSRKMVMQVLTVLADHGFGGLVVSETGRKYHNPEELQMDVLLHRRWRHRYDARVRVKSSVAVPVHADG